MALIAKSSGNFTPAPEGLWSAVCVDVVDLGTIKQEFKGKVRSAHKCKLVWEISEKMETGLRFLVSKWYTVSLHAKANLYKDLCAWRGKAFTTEELAGFDVEKVIGIPCQLVIVHSEKDGSTYANVNTIMKPNKLNSIQPAGTYVRVKDRPKDQADENSSNGYTEEEFSDAMDDPAYEQIPF
jgi:hypothetical protein